MDWRREVESRVLDALCVAYIVYKDLSLKVHKVPTCETEYELDYF